ncbi:MAG: hypothetical protein ABIR06_05005 [Cyclobacteriaceae bacterium]
MKLALSKRKNISLLEKDLLILETINKLGPCSSTEVKENLFKNEELLFVMRAMHTLVERGLLDRISIKGKMLYRTKRNYNIVKPYLKADL